MMVRHLTLLLLCPCLMPSSKANDDTLDRDNTKVAQLEKRIAQLSEELLACRKVLGDGHPVENIHGLSKGDATSPFTEENASITLLGRLESIVLFPFDSLEVNLTWYSFTFIYICIYLAAKLASRYMQHNSSKKTSKTSTESTDSTKLLNAGSVQTRKLKSFSSISTISDWTETISSKLFAKSGVQLESTLSNDTGSPVDPSAKVKVADSVYMDTDDGVSRHGDDVDHVYTIEIKTADEHHAGTDGVVCITLHGEKGSSPPVKLKRSLSWKDKFERGHTDVFIVPFEHLGKLKSVTIDVDKTRGRHILHPQWKLESIKVQALHNDTYFFQCSHWFHKKEGRSKTFLVTTTQQSEVDGNHRNDAVSGTASTPVGVASLNSSLQIPKASSPVISVMSSDDYTSRMSFLGRDSFLEESGDEFHAMSITQSGPTSNLVFTPDGAVLAQDSDSNSNNIFRVVSAPQPVSPPTPADGNASFSPNGTSSPKRTQLPRPGFFHRKKSKRRSEII
eukprot:m.755724 g.755724  ORF g.755724 m.755724 type:complete len:506 (-) comp23183_c0_seq14:214-1731(-)